MTTFTDIGINNELLQAVSAQGFTEPTPVQTKVIPLMLEQEVDIVSLAQTGTGKTAAFGLPLIQRIDSQDKRTQGLVLCPTRELCMQVSRDLENFARFTQGIRVLAIYGGASIEQQMRQLRKGIQIIVATPGRLRDLIQRGKVDISAVRYAVFDEADEMLQMGFQDELNAILAETPKEKNTLLFSATMSREVANIASRYMSDPVEITMGRKNSGAENVTHEYYLINGRDRYSALKRIVDNNPANYSIIFCRTRRDTQDVADKLIQDGYRADSLHGELSQAQRDLVMNKFRKKHLQLLVATDVAARGLDVNDLTHVINYSLPDDIAAYTHRSGRTGRAGSSGTSIALVDLRERHRIKHIEKKIGKKFTKSLIPTGKEVCTTQLRSLMEVISGTEVNHEQIDPLYADIEQQLAHLDREELIKKFISLEFNRFLKYYKDAPDLNQQVSGKNQKNFQKNDRQDQKNKTFTRFHLNVGRRNGVLPENLINTINAAPGGGRIKVGKIEIMRNTATLEGDSRFIPQILGAFQHFKVNGKVVTAKVLQPRTGGGRGRNSNMGKSRKPWKGRRPRH
ncbi:MAG: DEAD/DEAH box helicase [Candidatus Electrothrix sp. AW1]|nr:DEAD/DEAH box helicase [Candidatus Electrothrix sp. AX1]MCI5181005.1 DEAD/DEAH box helicase [Candidatus Electrothrix gigas]